LQIERERLFVNLLRGNDEARELSDESFDQVLTFTKAALDSAVALAAEFEHRSAEHHEAQTSPASSK
jgi:hypothetical protein